MPALEWPQRFSRLQNGEAWDYALYGSPRKWMYRRIDHIAFHVADLGRSIQFYEKHFGFKQYFQHEATGGMQIAYLKLGDTILELTHKAGDAPSGFHFCLEADNLSQAVAELKKNGVEMVRTPHDTPAREPREKGWRRVVFRGPDGEQIELRG